MVEYKNKMGTMHEGKLLFVMGGPLMMSMVLQALYNIVDSLFVAKIPEVGEAAVTALAIAFPIQMLMIALTVGTGVGVGAVLSRALGSGNRHLASQVAGNTITLYGVYFLALLLFGLFGVKAYIATQTSDVLVERFGIEYLQIITCFSLANMGQKCFEKLLQATGKATFSMLGQLTGAVSNILLDPIFIFGWFGVPAMGVKGAAIATIVAQVISVLVSGTLHYRMNTEVDHDPTYLKPALPVVAKILKIGAPAILMQALMSFMTYGMNLILSTVTASAVTAFGVYYKLQNFVFMPAFGLNNACVPIIGYNYGQKNERRIRQTIRYALLMVVSIMTFGILLFQTATEPIVSLFSLSAATHNVCVRALQIVSLGFIFAGINVLFQGVCQALGNGMYSLYISLSRLIVFVLPLAWFLAPMEKSKLFIWMVFPIAEALTLLLSSALTWHLYRVTIGRVAASSARSSESD